MSPLLDPANGEVGANVNRHEDDLGRLARNWKFESIPLHRESLTNLTSGLAGNTTLEESWPGIIEALGSQGRPQITATST